MALTGRLLIGFVLFLALLGEMLILPPAVAAGAAPISTLGVGARAWGRAGAYTASPDGGSGFSWNPAAPAAAWTVGVGISRSELFALQSAPAEGTTFNVVSYAAAVPRWGAIGLALRHLSSLDIPRTDAAGNVIGSFDAFESVTSLNWSTGWSAAGESRRGYALGAQVKWSAQAIDDESGSGLAADVGAQGWWPGTGPRWRMTRVGVAWQNAVSTPFRWTTGASERFDPNLRLGMEAVFGLGGTEATVALDWSRLDGLALGVEWEPVPALALRGGWRRGEGDGGFTIGLGFRSRGSSFDYAYVSEARPVNQAPSAMGDVHQISLSIGF